VAVLADGRVRATYTTTDGLAHDGVRTIYQTRDGDVWIGTYGGLSRIAGGRVTRSYTAADGLSAEHIRAIHEDRDGDLWVGTYGGGLNRFHDGAFTAITQRDGLADDVVSSILEDGRGQLWMSGNRGVFRVARAELVAFTEGHARRVHAVLYREADGLRNAETNGGFQPAAWQDSGGRLWFPTVRGLAVVDPARLTMLDQPPRVVVEEVVVDGAPRPPAAVTVVGPGSTNLEVRYAGLSLSAPQHVTFRYRLHGFDPEWVEAGARRVAYYPRLPPGRYRFVVTAANRDGVWHDTGTALDLRVLGPFWGTWWFQLAVVAALLGIVAVVARRRAVAARRWRGAQEDFARGLIESQEHERRRIAGELHDGLGQELLVVKNRALLALRADGLPGPVRDQLEHISQVASQSLDSVRGLAHNLTPYQLDHLGLSAALRTVIETAADTVPIAFDVAVEDVDGLLPIEAQINLYRIVQEAVTNIVRHSGARTAAVHVRRAGDAITVTVRDDGRGFELGRDGAGRPAGGFGLSGMAERARMLDGRLDVGSAPGLGTRLDLTVPVAAARVSPA
jgi:signal transduction histidine kinase